jgi:hypothetical protein
VPERPSGSTVFAEAAWRFVSEAAYLEAAIGLEERT